MRKILILAANPNDFTRRRLGEEVRDICEGLDRAQKQDEFEVVQRWAVRPRDLQRAMLEVSPQIVHFTGHSDGAAGLFFEDAAGQAKLVTGDALASLFKLFEDELECVVLNGCYSYDQAAAIAEHVPHVIGMRWAVNERAAIEFAVGFYDALGRGRAVEFAFEFGKTAMELEGTGDSEMPVLWPEAFVDEPVSVLPKSGLKPGAPFPRVRLPENYVERPDALKAVKDLLLAEDERTLVVSAISGLGGLGKSVLATALVLDEEVQARFADGILWVTLGQKPDLLTMLGDWIRELDKSRESFSANTVEAASRYLGNLLAERQILLVVDDVWNAAHAEWFRVGGPACRVLVTTREAVISGAERYSLDLMTPQEALDLVKGELGAKWAAEMEKPALEFAQMMGYLPLAVRLMAVQIARGRKWDTLKKAFLKAAKGLQALDYPSVRLKDLSEEEQRKYSLQACFQVSLERLKEDSLEYFERFVWLGVLPEDVILQQQMTTTLWDVEDWEAEETLLTLYERSFLTSGVTTIEGEPTYRVHDLMHDMACNLIEQGNLELSADKQCDLAENKQQNLIILAHRQFLERYRNVSTENCWHVLPNDGYIHRHLTWHLEQGNWVDEIHSLIKTSDTKNRNAWFEACERIGQPAIFVEDVARGWRLAENSYKQENSRSIVLQCRYALITATLNSLVGNLPIGMMAEFVKHNYWSVEQAWAYVEQMQDETKISEAIKALAYHFHLSKKLFQIAVDKTREVQDESRRADVLRELAKLDVTDFNKLLSAAREMQDEYIQADVLRELAKLDGADFDKLLSAAREMQDEYIQADMLRELAKLDVTDFDKLLSAAREVQDESSQAYVLRELAKLDGADFDKLLSAAREMQDESRRADVLRELAQLDGAYFDEALSATRKVQDESRRAYVLSELAKLDGVDFDKLLSAAREVQDESSQAYVLRELAQLDGAYFDESLSATREVQDESRRTYVLSELAQLGGADFDKLLSAAREVQDESSQAYVLSELAQLDGADFDKLLSAAREVQDESRRADVLRELAQLDGVDFDKLLSATQEVQDDSRRAYVLRELAKLDGVDFDKLLSAAREVQDDSRRAYVLKELAQLDGAYFDEALSAAREVQDDSRRADVLRELAKLNVADFDKLLSATQEVQDESRRADVLRELAQLDGVDFDKLLSATREIQDESRRAYVLRELAKLDGVDFDKLLSATREIQDESRRAYVLSELAKLDGVDFDKLLSAAQEIQDESRRAYVLSELAKLDGAYFGEASNVTWEMQDEFRRAYVLSELAKLDGADFDKLLSVAQEMQDESRRAYVLRELAKLDGVDFDKLLSATREVRDESRLVDLVSELAKLDGADFDKLLSAAREVQDESRRADLVGKLAKLDGAYFDEALSATQEVRDESKRADLVSELAKLDGADFDKLLSTAQNMQDESRRADLVSKLAKQVCQDFFPKIKDAINSLTKKNVAAKSLGDSLTYFPLEKISYVDWQTFLHLLAYRKRSDLMQDLVTLYPAIIHLGGEEAMRGVVDAMKDVCSQWK